MLFFKKLLALQMDIDQFYNEHKVTVKGLNIPKPIFTFEEGGFPGKRNFTILIFANCF